MTIKQFKPFFFSFLILAFVAVSFGYAAEKVQTYSAEQKLYLADSTDKLKESFLQSALSEPAKAYEYLLLARQLRPQILANPKAGEDLLRKIVAEEKITGRAKTLGLLMLAEIVESGGEFAQAQTMRKEAGVVPSWLVAGPFGKYEAGDFSTVFAPESAVDLSAVMQGAGRKVQWRGVDMPVALNRMKPWELVSPQRGIVYLLTAFELAEPTHVVVNIQTRCSLKAWVDGREVAGSLARFEKDSPVFVALKEANGAKLGAGWHTLLLKVQSKNTDSALVCSLNGIDGKAIKDVEFYAPGKEYPEVTAKGDYTFDEGVYPQWLKERTAEITAQEAAWRAQVLQAQGLYDLSLYYWKKAVAKSAANAFYLAKQGDAQRMCAFLPQARRDTLSRRSHLAALKLYPASVPSLLSLAEYEAGRKRFQQAGEYYAKAVKANSQAARVYVSRAKMAVENNWRMESLAWLNELSKKFPSSMGLPLLRARSTGKPGGLRDTAKYVELAWQNDQANVEMALQAMESYFKSGEKHKARALFAKLAPWQKKLPMVDALMARLLLMDSKAQDAVTGFLDASEKVGGDAEYLWAAAEASILAGNKPGAIESLKQSLKLNAGQPEVRRLLDALIGKTYEFWKKYAINGMKTLKDFQNEPKPSGSTARLIDQSVMTVYPDGSYTNYTHEMQAVLNASGVSHAAIIATYGELLQARTILPKNGLTLEPVLLPGQNKITMPAISTGAYTEHAYLLEQRSSPDLTLDFPVWFFRSPETEESFLLSQYIIRVPKGMDFSYAARNLADEVEFERREESDGFDTYIWTGRNMPRAIHEEGSPGITTTLPLVAISGLRNWSDVNRMFLNYISGKTLPSLNLLDKVKSLTDGVSDEQGKIAAIYHFVCREVESSTVALPASYSLEQLSGNRPLLLLAMLRAAGINANYVAARSPENIAAAPIWKLPTPMIFDKFLVRAVTGNGDTFWLDTRFRYNAMGNLPQDIAGGSAFVVSGNGGEFCNLPQAEVAEYTVSTTRNVQIAKDKILVEGTVVLPGIAGLALKESLVRMGRTQRLNTAEKLLQGQDMGLELLNVKYPGLDNSGKDLVLKYSGEYFGMLKKAAGSQQGIGGLLVHPELLPQRDNSRNRQTSYHLDRFVSLDDTLEIKLPEGKKTHKLPETVLIKNDFGYYRLSWSYHNGVVRIRRQCEFIPQIIPLEQWRKYRKMALAIRQAEERVLWWD